MSTVGGSWSRPKIINDGLVLYLDANTSNSYSQYFTPTTWKDLSGNGNNGTLVNGPGYSSQNGGSIVFDGVNDYVNLSPYYYDNLTNHTVIVMFNASVNTAWREIIQKGQRRDFKIRVSGFYPYNLDMSYVTVSKDYAYTHPFSINEWIFAAITIDTSSTGSFCAYINGQKMYEENMLSATELVETIDPRYYGELRLGNMSANSELFIGKIASTMMYNRTLTSEEILQNYNAIKTRFNLT